MANTITVVDGLTDEAVEVCAVHMIALGLIETECFICG